MGKFFIYYGNNIPLHGGAYLKPDKTLVFVNNLINIFGFLLKIGIVFIIAYLAYLLISSAYERYKERQFMIQEICRKVTEIEEFIKESSTNNVEHCENEEVDLEEKVKIDFIIDDNGIITECDKKIEEN